MSFLERHHLPWLIFVIDALAIAMVIAIAFLIVRAFPERGSASFISQTQEQTTQGIFQTTPADIQKEYQASLYELTTFVAAFNGSPVDLLKKIQEALFSMRVPGALRDLHLRAVLTIGQLQGSISAMSEGEARARLQAVVEGLVGKE